MIKKIKSAIARAVVNSDTFKSTLENVVMKEVEIGIRENDDVITQRELNRALDDFMYQNDLIDRYDIDEKIESAIQYFVEVETVQDMIDETELPDFVDRVEIEDMISDALSAEDLQVCDAESLRVACLRTLSNLIESAEDNPYKDGIANNQTSFNTPPANS